MFDAHKSLLGAAMKADLNQSADGVHAGITMGEIEKALELVPTGQKGSSNGGSADSAQNILSESFSQRVSGDKTQELSVRPTHCVSIPLAIVWTGAGM